MRSLARSDRAPQRSDRRPANRTGGPAAPSPPARGGGGVGPGVPQPSGPAAKAPMRDESTSPAPAGEVGRASPGPSEGFPWRTRAPRSALLQDGAARTPSPA